MPSKSEQILQALQALLETIPNARVERNTAVPARIPAGGLVILRDGDPGEPDIPLGGVGGAYYSHHVEIELYVQEADQAARDAAFDDLAVSIGEVLDSDSTISGLAFGMNFSRPAVDLESIEGAAAIKSGVIQVLIEYESPTVLG